MALCDAVGAGAIEYSFKNFYRKEMAAGGKSIEERAFTKVCGDEVDLTFEAKKSAKPI